MMFAGLVDLAALDRRVAPKALRIALESALAPSMTNSRQLRIKTALNQVVQQGLRHDGVLGCPLDHTERDAYRPCRQRQQRPAASGRP